MVLGSMCCKAWPPSTCRCHPLDPFRAMCCLPVNPITLPAWASIASQPDTHPCNPPTPTPHHPHPITPTHKKVISSLLALGPTVVRGNASEILALAGLEGATKGVDSTAAATGGQAASAVAAQQGSAGRWHARLAAVSCRPFARPLAAVAGRCFLLSRLARLVV